MTLRHVQTCDRCGASRDLEQNASRQLGGWRQLNVLAASAPLELCVACLREVRAFLVITRGHAAELAAELRDAGGLLVNEAGGDPTTLYRVADLLEPPADSTS